MLIAYFDVLVVATQQQKSWVKDFSSFPCYACRQVHKMTGVSTARTADPVLPKEIFHATGFHAQCINCEELAKKSQALCGMGWALARGWWVIVLGIRCLPWVLFFCLLCITNSISISINISIFYFISIIKLFLPQPTSFLEGRECVVSEKTILLFFVASWG